MNGPEASGPQLTFGGHLEVLRRMLFRILAMTGLLTAVVFACKETAWRRLLAPSGCDFVTYRLLSRYCRHALLLVFVLSAVITPPDIMTLLLVALPLYLLYEVSIRVVRWVE